MSRSRSRSVALLGVTGLMLAGCATVGDRSRAADEVTVRFLQKGSPESTSLGESGPETDQEQKVGPYAGAGSPKWARAGGWRRHVYSNSLGLVMGVIFLGSWLAQSVAVASIVILAGYLRQRGSRSPSRWAPRAPRPASRDDRHLRVLPGSGRFGRPGRR